MDRLSETPYEMPNHSDAPSCPSCGGYNALIGQVDHGPEAGFEPLGLKCRDCGAIHPHPTKD